jgi:hypothetical protein
MSKAALVIEDASRLYPPRGTRHRDHCDSLLMEHAARDPGDGLVAGGPWQKRAPSAGAG